MGAISNRAPSGESHTIGSNRRMLQHSTFHIPHSAFPNIPVLSLWKKPNDTWHKYLVDSEQPGYRSVRMIVDRATSRDGFTLIEVVISLVIFSFLMLIFAACIPMSHKTAEMNGQYAQAISLCQHKIDQMRAIRAGGLTYQELNDRQIIDDNPTTQPYSFMNIDHIAYDPDNPNDPDNPGLPDPIAATITIDNTYTDRQTVTVSITWKTQGYKSKTSTMSLSAIITFLE